MRAFSGFPHGRVRMIHLPEPLFTDLLPLVDDLDELKLTLHVLYRLSRQTGELRYLRHADLLDDRLLLNALGENPQVAVETALERAVERGSLLRAEAAQGTVYFANSPRGRAAVDALRRGEPLAEAGVSPRSAIFALYEENIGLLTPLIADELRAAEALYPDDWIEDAFRQAVAHNKRSWKYIHAILERWSTEGRTDEAAWGDRQQDRRRYIEGRYGEQIEH